LLTKRGREKEKIILSGRNKNKKIFEVKEEDFFPRGD
jgi:hypothetical protein